MRRGSLVVVGTGITLGRHVTSESLACMQQAEKLLYLVADPATDAWIRRLNARAETLESCYVEGKSRLQTYRAMTDRIVSAVRAGLQVCAAFYGHPGVFVDATHDAIRRVRRAGLPARMLPGISAEACLFADLGIDPGDAGWQSFEATDFLYRRRRFDPSSGLVLWQVGVLGEANVRKHSVGRPERLRVLTDVLRRSYPAGHRVVLYEAPELPVCDPRVRRIPLGKLPHATVQPMTTLYVPPTASRVADARIGRWLTED